MGPRTVSLWHLGLTSSLAFLIACAPTTTVPSTTADLPVMVEVPGGTFIMGDQTGSGDSDEGPAHNVTIASFRIGKYEITQGQWQDFLGATSKTTQALSPEERSLPATNVSWLEAKAYVAWLSDITGHAYDLPTEAQWEYAARAGASTLYPGGNEANAICRYGNVADQSGARSNTGWIVTDCDDGWPGASPVGIYQSNPFGIYDVVGNVWEWTRDCYSNSYRGARADGGAEESAGCQTRVIRGGSFQQGAEAARLSNRSYQNQSDKGGQSGQIGFRVVRNQ